MAHRFSSFVIRWWQSEKADRLTLEHIQTGERGMAASMDEAIAWLTSQQQTGGDRAVPEDQCGEGAEAALWDGRNT